MNTDRTPAVLAVLVGLGFFAVLGAIIWRGLPEHGSEPLLVLLGALAGAFGTIVNFYFGSSAGSAEKTRLLAQATPAVDPSVGDKAAE